MDGFPDCYVDLLEAWVIDEQVGVLLVLEDRISLVVMEMEDDLVDFIYSPDEHNRAAFVAGLALQAGRHYAA